jgi:NADPH:quinone reductase-like Zn-dependent oxidoreductase
LIHQRIPNHPSQTWITATQALQVVGEFAQGKKVLWHAGASGVSIAGIQLSRLLGASAVYATAGTQEKCDFVVHELGATAAFNYKTDDWAAGIRDATGGAGVDLVVDFVAGPYLQKNIDVAARDGRIVLLALLGGGKAAEVDIGQVLYKRLRLEAFLPEFESGRLRVVVDTVLPWEEVQKAHELLETNATSGKIVCTIS